MAIVTLGTTTSAYSTLYPSQRKIFKTTLGKLIAFANINDNICYKTSSDDGDTWDGSWTTAFNTGTSYSFDGYIESNNNIYIIVHSSSGLYFRKLTYSAGTWSLETAVQITASTRQYPVFAKRSNGDFWVLGNGGAGVIYAYYSTDSGGTWSGGGNFGASVNAHVVMANGTNIWAIVQASTKLTKFVYTSSWDAGVDIATGVSDSAGAMGGLRASDSEIYITAPTSSGIKIFKYNGSWDSGTLLSDNSLDNRGAICLVQNLPLVTWSDYDGSQYDISYRFYYGGTWQAQVDITSTAAVDTAPSSMLSDSHYLYVFWRGATTPYNIFFTKVNLATTHTQTITSDMDVAAYATYMIPYNYVTFSKLSVNNILNNFIMAIRNVLDINNVVNFLKGTYYNIANDFRTRKASLYNATNDVRFVRSWQVPGDAGIQSLGKAYLKVYIGGVLQTDVDVDSIKIDRNLASAATASFVLGRAYDSSAPSMESSIQIKYNNYLLYTGYITEVNPAENPEQIYVSCQDEYWYKDRNNKYFHIGHKPLDDKEKYYSTIKEALSAEFSFNTNIGNFTPPTIDCFAIGESSCFGSLIEECGNYSFYYDVNKNKKLWTADRGTVINLKLQELGNNIKLYDILDHNERISIDNLVNKFRVQMGDKVIRNVNNRQYVSSFYTKDYNEYATPAWSSSHDSLHYDAGTEFGYNRQDPAHPEHYEKVFKEYNLPFLDDFTDLEDRDEPYIEIKNAPFSNYHIANGQFGKMTSGFTLDYKNNKLILSSPIYLYKIDSQGQMHYIRAPRIEVFLFKKIFYPSTNSDTENPETDISNPLMFFTDKMGSYPVTVINELSLSNLSIQEGYTYINYETGEIEIVPSWDDTEYARDYANWKLSQICDEKHDINIEITLDCLCYYGIDLNNRIKISNLSSSVYNINSISIDGSNFTATIALENFRYYNRTVSIQTRVNPILSYFHVIYP